MNPRMVSEGSVGVTGSGAYTSMLGFKLTSSSDNALRTLVQIGSSSQCRAQIVVANGLQYSGCVDSADSIVFSADLQTTSSHIWAVMHDGETAARSYWNGAYFSHTTATTWNTADGPLYLGRSVAGVSSHVLPGGARWLLVLNRALNQRELAAVARWSWDTHRVGIDLMNFSPNSWTNVNPGQIYWAPPVHMQPLSQRTLVFMIDVTSTSPDCRSIVRFGSGNNDNYPHRDRMMYVELKPGFKRIHLGMTRSDYSNEIDHTCSNDLSGPSLVTLSYTRTSVSAFFNAVKASGCSVSALAAPIADTDKSRSARQNSVCSVMGGFTVRSLQLLDYAMTDIEAQAPVIISVTPPVLLSSHTVLTVTGSRFAVGNDCKALFFDGSVASCQAVSAVEIWVAVNSAVPLTRASLLMIVIHNGMTLQAPVRCLAPFFVMDSSGFCTRLKASVIDFAISSSDRIASKTGVSVTLSFTVPVDIRPGNSITLNYPPNFFAPAPNPEAIAATDPGIIIACSAFNQTQVVLTPVSSSIGASDSFTVIVRGATMGPVMPSFTSVSLQMSTDVLESSSVPSGAIFRAVGSGGAVHLSRYLAGASNVAATVSFVAASALSSAAVKLISITGLRFASYMAPPALSFCSNVNVTTSAEFTPSSGILLLNFSRAAVAAVPTAAIECVVTGFTNANVGTGTENVTISTYDVGGWPLQTQGSIGFPSIFAAEGINDNGGVTLSSYLVGDSFVTASIAFVSGSSFASVPFKSISITGLRFSEHNSNSAGPMCANIDPLYTSVTSFIITIQSGVLVISLSNAAISVAPTTPIVCSIHGLTNAAATSAAASVSVSTFDADGLPLQIWRGLEFPAIFPVVGAGGSVALSSYVANRQSIALTFSFSLPAHVSVLRISVTGLRFVSFDTSLSAGAACFNRTTTNTAASVSYTPSLGPLVLSLSSAIATAVAGSAVTCRVPGFTNIVKSPATNSVTIAAFHQNGAPVQTQPSILFPELINPSLVSRLTPTTHPSTAHIRLSVYGTNVGVSDWSSVVRVGSTSCASTTWQSETVVVCRAAAGIGLGMSVTASVLMNHGTITNVFSYRDLPSNVSSAYASLPLSGTVQVSLHGINFGTFNPSQSAKFGETACELSLWRSTSIIRSKVSGPYNRFSLFLSEVTVAQFKFQAAGPISPTSFRYISISDAKTRANTASTGGALAEIIGRNLGGALFSARHRLSGTAFKNTRWLSDSCVHLRASDGVVTTNTTLVLSFPSNNASLLGTISSAYSYNAPSPTAATSKRLSSISISGSNFGSYLAVVPRTTRCAHFTALAAFSSEFICNSSVLNVQDEGVTVTEAAVSVTFSHTTRLDDVVISMISPQQKEYTLMRGKCFGALPCAPSSSVSFTFQILPISQSVMNVPLMLCPSSGIYVPDMNDVMMLRSNMISHTAIGNWSLRVTCGAQNQNVSSASFHFKTANLEVQIDNSSTTSLEWFSDSSLMMKAPGHQEHQGSESSSAWGRNRTVTVLASGIRTPSSCLYSYPDPVLNGTSGDATYLSSGNTLITLNGRYISNANPSPLARMGRSSCLITRWQSDTSLTCIQPPSIGSTAHLAATIYRSAVANMSSSFSFFQRFGDAALFVTTTAATSVTVVGSGFGAWDSSVRARVARQSSAQVTFWWSDTRIATKVLPMARMGPIILVSLVGIVSNISQIKSSHIPVEITTCNSSSSELAKVGDTLVIASSGAAAVAVVGIGFGSFVDHSVRVNFAPSSAQFSAWVSDSIVRSKSSWGFFAHNPAMIVSTAQSRVNRTNVFQYSRSHAATLSVVNGSAVAMAMNGTSFAPFQIPALLKIDDRAVVTHWTSDSSIRSEYPWPVSRDVVAFVVRVFEPTSDGKLLSTSVPANPIFIPSSKPIAESLNVMLYIPAPANVVSNMNEFILRGSSTGWMFPAQTFSSPPSFFESEIMDLDIVVYTNHTQVYLKDYSPISIDLNSNLSLYDSSNNLINDRVCFGDSVLSKSLSLAASAFATSFRTSFAICSLSSNAGLQLVNVVVTVRVLDESGSILYFSTKPVSLHILRRPQALLSSQFAHKNFSAGTVNEVPMKVSLVNTGASCSRLLFEYTANISCLSGQKRAASSFVRNGLCNAGNAVSAIQQRVEKSCDIDFQSWTFETAGPCYITVHVFHFAIALDIPIFVRAGNPHEVFVVGRLSPHLKTGDIIWSNNASVLKCLELRFADACNNSRQEGGFSCNLSAFLSNMTEYSLRGPTSVDADSNGRCIWCSARVSLSAPLLVKLQVKWLNSDRYLEPLVNVSGMAEAAVLSVAAPSFSNESKAGSALAPITFKLFDANGAAVSASNTVIRVRIIRKSRVAAAVR
jgi:hypothetical protein